MKALAFLFFSAAMATSVSAFAQTSNDHSAHHAGGAVQATESTDGEVRRVDVANRKITLRHGEIKNLQMPPMTMVFDVKDAALLAPVKQGDAVRFKVERIDGAFVVTALEVVR